MCAVAFGPERCANPVERGAGTDTVFVSRVREDATHPNGLNLRVVADNARKGAVFNSVQITERVAAIIA